MSRPATRDRGGRGEIVVSADADTTYPPGWLAAIAAYLDDHCDDVGVGGPCRFEGAQGWARVYTTLLLGAMWLLRRLTGRTVYVTATNLAFRRSAFTGYDVDATQGGDEWGLLRRLRPHGRIGFELGHPSCTSARRLDRGIVHTILVTCLYRYVIGYHLNRLAGRRVVGTAPPVRPSATAGGGRFPARTALVAVTTAALLLGVVVALMHGLRGRFTWGAAGVAGLSAVAHWAAMSPFSQALGPFPYRAADESRRIALTFDDGPNEPFTSEIADVLAQHDVPATFFQVGRCIERHPEVSAQLVAAGHVVGNHSLSHEFHRGIRRSDLVHEIAANQEILADRLGRRPALSRPPWLLRTPALFDVLAASGLTAVSGEFCHAAEVLQPSPGRIAGRALAKAEPGAILIFHDGFDGRGGNRTNTVRAVRIVVRELRRSRYEFTTVDRLLGVPAYRAC